MIQLKSRTPHSADLELRLEIRPVGPGKLMGLDFICASQFCMIHRVLRTLCCPTMGFIFRKVKRFSQFQETCTKNTLETKKRLTVALLSTGDIITAIDPKAFSVSAFWRSIFHGLSTGTLWWEVLGHGTDLPVPSFPRGSSHPVPSRSLPVFFPVPVPSPRDVLSAEREFLSNLTKHWKGT